MLKYFMLSTIKKKPNTWLLLMRFINVTSSWDTDEVQISDRGKYWIITCPFHCDRIMALSSAVLVSNLYAWVCLTLHTLHSLFSRCCHMLSLYQCHKRGQQHRCVLPISRCPAAYFFDIQRRLFLCTWLFDLWLLLWINLLVVNYL